MQSKTTMRYHLTPVRMAIINKFTNSKCWWGRGERRTLLHCWWECRLVQPLWKAVWNYFKKLKTELPYNPAILLLGIYLTKPKTLTLKNICTPMLIVVLFTIAKCWAKCQQQMSGSKDYGTFTQWNSTQQRERRSLYPLEQHGWNWRALC